MKKFITNLFKRSKKLDIKKVAEQQLKKNISVIKSLRDYDEGRKNISTSDIKTHLPDIRTAR